MSNRDLTSDLILVKRYLRIEHQLVHNMSIGNKQVLGYRASRVRKEFVSLRRSKGTCIYQLRFHPLSSGQSLV